MDTHNYQDQFGLQSLDHSLTILEQIIATEQSDAVIDHDSHPHFNTSHWLASNEELPPFVLPTEHINLELSARSFGDNLGLAKQMVTTMLANFYTDLQDFQDAYDQEQWPAFQRFIHQLRGAVAYCGTPRLEAICVHLEQQLRNIAPQINKLFIRPLYRQLLMEIKTIQYQITAIDPVLADV